MVLRRQRGVPLRFLTTCKGATSEYPVTWLIAVIGLFLLTYIILLPPGEKERLVGEQPVGGGYGGVSGGGQITSGIFLSEHPGILYPPESRIINTPLASASLFSTIEPGSESLASSVTVKNSAFREEKKDLAFSLADAHNIQDAQLLFLVKEGNGDLIVSLNGQEIFRGQVSVDDLPLRLPRSLLQTINHLEFRVSGPGLNIFASHEYVLKDVQIFFKRLSENKLEARTFVVSNAELPHLQRMTLYFLINCFTLREDGRLVVTLNGKVIADGLVVCDAGPAALELDNAHLIAGRNVLTFSVDKGKYVLEQMVLQRDIGPDDTARYLFTLQVADFQFIAAGAHPVLDMQLANDGLRKIGTVYVNGFPVYLDTFADRFVYDLAGLVGPGTNIVRIVPAVPMDIVSMTVGLV